LSDAPSRCPYMTHEPEESSPSTALREVLQLAEDAPSEDSASVSMDVD